MFFYLLNSEKSRTFALVIELDRHIEILLLSNDCVIVPGLGGFMAHHVDARFDTNDNMFLPPLRTLGFNPQLKMNDSLLVQSYIEAYDISYPEALRRIEEEVDELRQHLDTDGCYELNDIGVLSRNEDGKLEFEPCEAGILTPSLYGLGSFEMTPIVKAEEKPIETVVSETEEQELPDEKPITIKMSWLRNIAAAAAAIIAFFMIGTPISNSNKTGNIQQSAFIPMTIGSAVAEQVPDKPADSAEAITGKALETTTEPLTIAEEENPISPASEMTAADAVERPAQKEYCIVLASQVSQKGAERYVEQLQAEGHTEARVLMSKTRVRRVVYGSYPSDEEASTCLHSLRSQNRQFREAWVMEVKE